MSVRNFTWNDLPALLDFTDSIQSKSSHQSQDLRRRTFQEVLTQPWLAPEENCLLLEVDGIIQGYCLIFPELPIKRAVLGPDIAPDLAGSPQESELVRRALARADQLGAKVAHLCLAEGSPRRHLLEEQGFSLERVYWDMVWRGESVPQPSAPDGFIIRPFHLGDAATLTEIQNSAFTGSWGFSPNTLEQIEYRSSMSNTSHPGILFLGDEEQAAGYCWTCIAPADEKIRGVIGMIGVSPVYRGRGLSKPLLLAGMQFLKSTGVADIGLHVDGNNVPAIRLYTSVGFEKVGELHWFEFKVGPD